MRVFLCVSSWSKSCALLMSEHKVAHTSGPGWCPSSLCHTYEIVRFQCVPFIRIMLGGCQSPLMMLEAM